MSTSNYGNGSSTSLPSILVSARARSTLDGHPEAEIRDLMQIWLYHGMVVASKFARPRRVVCIRACVIQCGAWKGAEV